jgi:hypothetical protein
MEISTSLICPCNKKLYKSEQCLKAHRKTQSHQFWEKTNEQKDISIKINKLEIENGHLRRLNILLMERIQALENK